MKNKKDIYKSVSFMCMFVLLIVVAGITISYAYYTLNMRGSTTTDTNQAANLSLYHLLKLS